MLAASRADWQAARSFTVVTMRRVTPFPICF
jgi:hypothetical protein